MSVETVSFSVIDTRRFCQQENRAELHSVHSTLTFRADLQECAQRAAVRADRRRVRDANNLRCEKEVKAKSQGTLVSVLEQEESAGKGKSAERVTTPLSASDEQRLRQKFLALAFLITEAYGFKKRELRNKHLAQHEGLSPLRSGNFHSNRDNSSTRPAVDIGDVKTVNLLLSDFKLLLQQQQLTDVDVEQFVRIQLSKLTLWQH